ncbi:MAG: glycosyltransferase family 4 protein [Lentisphaerae bacterium]|nr:glycosyltransferase family 4 protein [Lentisphaerota bacterium]
MKVCIDIQAAKAQRAGVGRYTRSLVRHLPELKHDDEITLFSFDFLRAGLPIDAPGTIQKTSRICPGRFVSGLWKTINFPPFDWFSGKADIFHFPNFVIPPLNTGKTVVTIHDASFVRYPEFAERKNLRHLNAVMRNTVRRADAIITDSHFSATEIEETLSVDTSRISPIHLGIDDCFSLNVGTDSHLAQKHTRESIVRSLGIDRPFIFTVGTIEPRKNTSFLVDVFERMEDFDGHLVVAGMKGWKFQSFFKKMQESKSNAEIIYLDYVTDDQLFALYTEASLFVFPSHYEGFGFPPLEAMACGTPVLSSNGGSLPEVLGDAAFILPATDPEEWAEQSIILMQDTDLRNELINSGKEKASSYKWADTAAQTWDVYRKVLA